MIIDILILIVKMNWGSELWDCVDEVFAHVAGDLEDISGVFGKFIKERGEIEKEYAKSLRKLCNKYSSREEKRENGKSLEFSRNKAFR